MKNKTKKEKVKQPLKLEKLHKNSGSSSKFKAADHWKGMPEFNQPGIEPAKVLTVNFETMEHVLKFSKMIGQEITAKTRSVWFPVVPQESAIDKRWSDRQKK